MRRPELLIAAVGSGGFAAAAWMLAGKVGAEHPGAAWLFCLMAVAAGLEALVLLFIVFFRHAR